MARSKLNKIAKLHITSHEDVEGPQHEMEGSSKEEGAEDSVEAPKKRKARKKPRFQQESGRNARKYL